MAKCINVRYLSSNPWEYAQLSGFCIEFDWGKKYDKTDIIKAYISIQDREHEISMLIRYL